MIPYNESILENRNRTIFIEINSAPKTNDSVIKMVTGINKDFQEKETSKVFIPIGHSMLKNLSIDMSGRIFSQLGFAFNASKPIKSIVKLAINNFFLNKINFQERKNQTLDTSFLLSRENRKINSNDRVAKVDFSDIKFQEKEDKENIDVELSSFIEENKKNIDKTTKIDFKDIELQEKRNKENIVVNLSSLVKENKKNTTIDLSSLAAEQEKKKISDKERIEIGKIRVISRDKSEMWEIPFQFNPTISFGSYSAQYSAQNIVSRIGALQTYNHTDISNSASLELTYMVVDDIYNLSKIQEIQRMYESLVMPNFNIQYADKPFAYMGPPYIKIIMGDLFTHQIPLNNFLASENLPSKRHKTYVVTSVTIEKDLDKFPVIIRNKSFLTDSEKEKDLYLNNSTKDEYELQDTFGFSVKLDLLEVTMSYMDIYPDFSAYAETFNKYKG